MTEGFVLSSSKFDSVKDAEKKVEQWFEEGTLKHKEVKLFKVVEMYDLKLKFVKRRK